MKDNNLIYGNSGIGLLPATKHPPAKSVAFKASLYVLLIAIGVVSMFPFLFMVNRGLMSNEYVLQANMHYFPDGLHVKNYILAFSDGGYGMPLVYSIIVCLITGFTIPFSTLLPAYAFSKLEWIGKKTVFAFMMFTSLIPSIVTQVPLFVLYTNLGFINTLYPLFLPGIFFAGAMNVFLARQFLMSIPKEMEESARLDGAGPLRRCFTICAPLCKAIFIYLGVGAFIGSWGDYITPSVYTTDPDAPFTFAYALYDMTSKETNSAHPEWIFAAATIVSVVPAVLFGFFQKYLIEGIASAGIKG